MSIEQKFEVAINRLKSAVEKFKPTAVIGLFSGGHDSRSALAVAMQSDRFSGAGLCNTGIGIEATYDYIRSTCSESKCPLFEKCGQSYEELVMRWGFPGPHVHGVMYRRLKERALRKIKRELIKPRSKEKIIWVSGCRSQESRRRMANTKEISISGNEVWVAPIHDFSKEDTDDLLAMLSIERSPVVDAIGMSGECKCGAFAQPGELEELNQHDITRPLYHRIKALEEKVMPIHPWGWEDSPPAWSLEKKAGQTFMLEYDQPLCWNCHIQKAQLAEAIRP